MGPSNRTRNSTVVSRHFIDTGGHSADDKSSYDAALDSVRPLMLLSYSATDDSTVPSYIPLTEASLSCVQVKEITEGSRGDAAKRYITLGGLAVWVSIISFFLQL